MNGIARTAPLRPRGWLAALGAAAAVLAARGLLVAADTGTSPLGVAKAVDAAAPFVVSLVAARLAGRIGKSSRHLGRAFTLLAVAYLAYAVAESAWAFLGARFDAPPGSYVLSALYLAFYPLFLLGVLHLPAAPLTRQERTPLLLDMGIVVLGITLVLWTLLMHPALAAGAVGTRTPLRMVMTLASPAGDLVVLWALLTLVLRHRERALSATYGLLAASAAFMIVTDLLYAYHLQYLVADLRLWHFLGWGWMASHVLAALAASRLLVSPEAAALSEPEPDERRHRPRASLYLAYACLLAVVLVLTASRRGTFDLAGAVIVIGIIGLILARKIVGIAEGERLRSALLASHEELELRVVERTAELARANEELAGEVEVRKSAQRRLERQIERLAALRAIDLAITGSNDLGVTLDVFLQNVMSQLGVDASAVLLRSPVSHELEPRASKGFRSTSRGPGPLAFGQGHAGLAALERRVVRVPDLATEPDARSRAPLYAAEGFWTYHAAPLVARGEVRGVLEVFTREPLAVDDEWLEFLATLAGQGAIAVDNTSLLERTQRSHVELALAYDSTLTGWSLALELRDGETQGHSLRVTDGAVRLGRALGMGDDELVQVRRGALLHDIGKMAIPDSILLKRGPLTDEEWRVMRTHPVHAFELLSHVTYLKPALDIPYCHHEHWDGSGYPRGLKGTQIPLAARAFSIVDNWDALAFARPYREAWPEERVRAHIAGQAGKLFDPEVTDAFLAMSGCEAQA